MAKVRSTIDFSKLKVKFEASVKEALTVMAVELLNNSIYGSSRVNLKSPLDFGHLRRSGSAFVGMKRVGISYYPVTFDQFYRPARYNNPKTDAHTVTVGFNAPYAERMHEDSSLNPGPRSVRDGNSNPGNGWLRAHLYGDGLELFKGVAETIRKGMKN